MQHNVYLDEIRAWSKHALEKPLEYFNNLPPCPYAEKAWEDKRVDCVIKDTDNKQVLYTTVSQFPNNLDIVLIIDKKYEKSAKDFHDYLDAMNVAISRGMFIDKDIWVMGFHPDDEASEYVDDANFCHLTEESYAIIFVQRLTKLHESADKLKKRGYYKIYSKEYNADAIFKLRETLYRRLKDGNET